MTMDNTVNGRMCDSSHDGNILNFYFEHRVPKSNTFFARSSGHIKILEHAHESVEA